MTLIRRSAYPSGQMSVATSLQLFLRRFAPSRLVNMEYYLNLTYLILLVP